MCCGEAKTRRHRKRALGKDDTPCGRAMVKICSTAKQHFGGGTHCCSPSCSRVLPCLCPRVLVALSAHFRSFVSRWRRELAAVAACGLVLSLGRHHHPPYRKPVICGQRTGAPLKRRTDLIAWACEYGAENSLQKRGFVYPFMQRRGGGGGRQAPRP